MGSDYEMSQDEDEDGDNSQVNGQSSTKKRQIEDDEYDSEVIPHLNFNYCEQYDSEQEASKSVSKFGGINEEEEQFTLPFNAVRYLGQ